MLFSIFQPNDIERARKLNSLNGWQKQLRKKDMIIPVVARFE